MVKADENEEESTQSVSINDQLKQAYETLDLVSTHLTEEVSKKRMTCVLGTLKKIIKKRNIPFELATASKKKKKKKKVKAPMVPPNNFQPTPDTEALKEVYLLFKKLSEVILPKDSNRMNNILHLLPKLVLCRAIMTEEDSYQGALVTPVDLVSSAIEILKRLSTQPLFTSLSPKEQGQFIQVLGSAKGILKDLNKKGPALTKHMLFENPSTIV